MSSVFSFIRPPEPEPGAEEQPQAETPTAEAEETAAGLLSEVSAAAALPGGGIAAAPLSGPGPVLLAAELAPPQLTSVVQVPAAIVDILDDFLPPVEGGLPTPGILILNITDKTLGLGNLRGLETRGIFPAVEQRGGHVAALLRFQLFGNNSDQVNNAILNLQGQLLAARADLWDVGFLEMTGVGGTLAVQVAEAGPWERSIDYQVLFEYHLVPTSGAESLISRIPIQADQEVFNSIPRETTTVTDEMIRWDDQSASSLVVRGPTQVGRLSSLVFIPGANPGGTVTLLRTHDGAAGPPGAFASLGDFLNALADPSAPVQHGEFTFASIGDLLASFSTAGDPLPLGDWNEDSTADQYQPLELKLDPPIRLPDATDRLEISLGVTPLDQAAVIYLRARRM